MGTRAADFRAATLGGDEIGGGKSTFGEESRGFPRLKIETWGTRVWGGLKILFATSLRDMSHSAGGVDALARVVAGSVLRRRTTADSSLTTPEPTPKS
jgi:hypothetical protein